MDTMNRLDELLKELEQAEEEFEEKMKQFETLDLENQA